MKIRLNGKRYKYRSKYFKREDDLNVKRPAYTIYRYGMIFYDGKWKDCRFHIFKKSSKMIAYISPVGVINNGISELGKVDEQGFVERIEVAWFNSLLINSYDIIFYYKVRILSFTDGLYSIRKNIIFILLAILGASIYFFVNKYFDNYLQELINKSNFVQSLIVFLSLSSLINIFHPFTLRKELNIKEVDELITKKSKKMIEDKEQEEYIKNQATL